MKKKSWLLVCVVVGCSSAAERPSTRAELLELGDSEGWETDWCTELGYYGDGAFCDCYCPERDIDCELILAPTEVECDERPPPEDSDPCGAGLCGASCVPDGLVLGPDAPVDYQCDNEGVCRPGGAESCEVPCDLILSPLACDEPYDSCGGRTCGDACTVCDPSDPDCVETADIKQCSPSDDGVLVCTSGFATCE